MRRRYEVASKSYVGYARAEWNGGTYIALGSSVMEARDGKLTFYRFPAYALAPWKDGVVSVAWQLGSVRAFILPARVNVELPGTPEEVLSDAVELVGTGWRLKLPTATVCWDDSDAHHAPERVSTSVAISPRSGKRESHATTMKSRIETQQGPLSGNASAADNRTRPSADNRTHSSTRSESLDTRVGK